MGVGGGHVNECMHLWCGGAVENALRRVTWCAVASRACSGAAALGGRKMATVATAGGWPRLPSFYQLSPYHFFSSCLPTRVP